MSVEYYAKLERGSLGGVSASVLDAIARALQLDEAERNHLFNLAHAADGTSAAIRPRGRSRNHWTARPSLQWTLDSITTAPAILGNNRSDLLATNLLLGSFVLAMYRALAALATTRADRLLATLSLQDVARSVAYGTAHMRYHLAHQPARAAVFAEYLDRTEHTVVGIAGSPEFLEPLVVVAAGAVDAAALARGSTFVRRWFATALGEYLERCRAAGLGDRRERSRLPRLAAALAA